MNSKLINSLVILFIPLFILSCQGDLDYYENNKSNSDNNKIENYENTEKLDLSYEEDITFNESKNLNNTNFLLKQNKISINNYGKKYKSQKPLNVYLIDNFYYALNHKSTLLKIDIKTYKIIEKYDLELPIDKNETLIPVSFVYFNNSFIIGYKSGKVIKIDMNNKVKWVSYNNKILNTSIKIIDDMIILVFNDTIKIVSFETGEVIYEKFLENQNIIQSKGGKIVNYYNLLFILMPNSSFIVIDTLLYNEHINNFNNSNFITPLNNLNDDIHIYKNYFTYIDNGKYLYTFDIIKDQYIIENYQLNKSDSFIFFNNSIITKTKNHITFYNVKNGKIFNKIDISNILKNEKSKIINVQYIKEKLYLFLNDGFVLIINNDNSIETINLKIKNINKIYSSEDNIFFSINNGKTIIF